MRRASRRQQSQQRDAHSRAKNPQLRPDQSEIVRGAADHRIQRAAQGAFQLVAARSAIHFHVPDRHDDAPPIDRRLQGFRDALLLNEAHDAHRQFHANASHCVRP